MVEAGAIGTGTGEAACTSGRLARKMRLLSGTIFGSPSILVTETTTNVHHRARAERPFRALAVSAARSACHGQCETARPRTIIIITDNSGELQHGGHHGGQHVGHHRGGQHAAAFVAGSFVQTFHSCVQSLVIYYYNIIVPGIIVYPPGPEWCISRQNSETAKPRNLKLSVALTRAFADRKKKGL